MAVLAGYLPAYGIDVLKMPIEELAVHFIRYLRAHEVDQGPIRMRNLIRSEYLTAYVPEEVGEGGRIEMARRLAEAWGWLHANGCIAPDPDQQEGWCFVTDRGRDLASQPYNRKAFEASVYLPAGLMDARLEQEARPDYLRGAYDKAVFSAMRLVEIQVRGVCGYPDDLIGVDLIRKAFHPDKGPLSDPSRPKAERERIRDLFVGAIGSFKNPPSHREVNLTDPVEVANIIRLADVLLRIVHRTDAYMKTLAKRTAELVKQ